MGEHLPYKQGVIGSSPIVPTNICGNGSVVERCLAKANVASSNLVSRSKGKGQVNTCPFPLERIRLFEDEISDSGSQK